MADYPPSFDDAKATAILKQIKLGSGPRAAAGAHGISYSTLRIWAALNDEFAYRLEVAKDARVKILEDVVTAGHSLNDLGELIQGPTPSQVKVALKALAIASPETWGEPLPQNQRTGDRDTAPQQAAGTSNITFQPVEPTNNDRVVKIGQRKPLVTINDDDEEDDTEDITLAG